MHLLVFAPGNFPSKDQLSPTSFKLEHKFKCNKYQKLIGLKFKFLARQILNHINLYDKATYTHSCSFVFFLPWHFLLFGAWKCKAVAATVASAGFRHRRILVCCAAWVETIGLCRFAVVVLYFNICLALSRRLAARFAMHRLLAGFMYLLFTCCWEGTSRRVRPFELRRSVMICQMSL